MTGVPSSILYLTIMLTVIAVLVMITVPALFWKKCRQCGRRNGLDSVTCKYCGQSFPAERD